MRHGSVDLLDTELNVLIPARVSGGTAAGAAATFSGNRLPSGCSLIAS